MAVVGRAAAEPDADSVRVAPKRPPDRALIYKKTSQAELKIHVYLPDGWKASDRRPVAVFFFGGGWIKGGPQQFFPASAYLASRGIVAASAEYRIYGKHGNAPDVCIQDAKSAVRWVRDNAASLGVDGKRLIAGGGSAGGHLAVATYFCPDTEPGPHPTSCDPDALVLFNPAVDAPDANYLKRSMPKASVEEREAVAAKVLPLRFMNRKAPPSISFFGTDDALLAGGRTFVETSRALGGRAELWTAAGKKHGFFNGPPWWALTVRKADEFLTSLGYLKGPPTLKPENDDQRLTAAIV